MKLWHTTIIGQQDEGNFCETWSKNANYWSEVENAADGRNDILNGKSTSKGPETQTRCF